MPLFRFRNTFRSLLCWLLLTAGASCEKQEPEPYVGPGKRPVYLALDQFPPIQNLAPQMIQQTGAIFLLDTLFFMVEQKKGIHVFNVKDSSNVQYLTFFQIPAVTAFSISGNRLYADSWKDLVTIDVSNLFQIKEIDRQTGVFSPLLFPPLYQGYFECVDDARGAVVDWVDDRLEHPLCRTLN